MHLLKFSVNEGRRPQTGEQNQRQKEGKCLEFQPFQNERDSMGRLLKHTRTEERGSPLPYPSQPPSCELQPASRSR